MIFNNIVPASALMAALLSTVSAMPTADLSHGSGGRNNALHRRQATGSSSSSSASSSSSSGVTPTAPGPGDKFAAGGNCMTEWSPGSSAAWKEFDIDLMTGSNTQMTKLATIATGLDGSSSTTTSVTFKCPEVAPYSAIYFYQYTPKGTSNGEPTWTTRFTITDANGQSTPEPQKTQPDGKNIPWGTGQLAGGFGGSGSGNASGNSTASSGTASSSSSSSSTTAASRPPSSSSSSSSASSPSSTSDSTQQSTQQASNNNNNAAKSSSSSSQGSTGSSTSGALANVASSSGVIAFAAAAVAAAALLV